jgi:hypothetical protein
MTEKQQHKRAAVAVTLPACVAGSWEKKETKSSEIQ